MNLLYPDFSKDERNSLIFACIEEIRYWKRMNLSTFSFQSNRFEQDTKSNSGFFDKHPGLEDAVKKRRKEMIEKYLSLYRKVRDSNNTEYDVEEIHWLKIMCQEIIPQINRHAVVKMQPDGTGSEKHAHEYFKIGLEHLKKETVKEYTGLSEKLKKMDTIPEDGLSEPKGFVFKP